jgi:two-component sensor histidine kinase/DNA-binding response OmpR family regulator
MANDDKVNILLVDDQPAKLLAYEVILKELDENLLKASSAREALEHLLKSDVAVVLVDVCMPELDGFELAAMIREHPRFQRTAIIFISAVQFTDIDRLRGYQMGAVDYVPVPVVPEVLRAKVKIFSELYRKTRDLESLNQQLELRVRERTQELEASTARLMDSERRRTLALAAGKMGSWDYDAIKREFRADEGHYQMFGVEPGTLPATPETLRAAVHPEDWERLYEAYQTLTRDGGTLQAEFRVLTPDGRTNWVLATAAADIAPDGRLIRIGGVTLDITERKLNEQTQVLLAREVDHRARNALAVVQSIVRLTRAQTTQAYMSAVEGRISALARAHGLLSQSRWQGADLARLVHEEVAPYKNSSRTPLSITGSSVSLAPATAQTVALVLHELATNAAKYGALSSESGRLAVDWRTDGNDIELRWSETGLSRITAPTSQGFGTVVIRASVQDQLRGTLSLDWRPEGLLCTVRIPGEPKKAQDAPEVSPARPVTEEPSRAAHVLLVEDETLVGLMMTDFLEELGHIVVGPYTGANEAMAALDIIDVDGAILDVNLVGGAVYPLADELVARGVPFVFVTGYDQASIDERFKDVPILQKPIEGQKLEGLFVPRGRSAKPRAATNKPFAATPTPMAASPRRH